MENLKNIDMNMLGELFNFFMDSSSIIDFGNKSSHIRKKINSYDCLSDDCVSYDFYIGLLDDYVSKICNSRCDSYAEKKKKMKSGVLKCVYFLFDLSSIPSEKCLQYLDLKGIRLSVLRENLESFKTHYGLDSFGLPSNLLESYCKFIDEKKKREKELRYNNACAFYDNIINSGCYSIYDYMVSNDLDPQKYEEITSRASRCAKVIRDVNLKKWESYLFQMNCNKIEKYASFKSSIDEFMKSLSDESLCEKSVDVIDYYLTVGIPFKQFKELFSVVRSDMSKFNIFISKYTHPNDYVDYSNINYTNFDGTISVNDEEKTLIGEFLKKHKIPMSYYPIAIAKYLKGDLDIKPKTFKKEI